LVDRRRVEVNVTLVIIAAAWIAAVAVVDLAVMRPWTSPAARAGLALGPAVAVAAWVIVTGLLSYRTMIADGAWTGASIALAFVPIKAIVLSLIAYAAGRTFLKGRAAGGASLERWAVPAVLAAITIYSVVSDVRAMHGAAAERHAANPALTPAEVNTLLAKLRAGEMGEFEAGAFLRNPACPPAVLNEYAASSNPYFRMAVAGNSALDPVTAEKLAADSDEEVRYYLAFNRKLPPALLTRLAADPSEMVRETVAWTEALPEDAFAKLVDDPSPRVRAVAAIQSRLSEEQLTRLRNDPEQTVRDAANRWAQ